MNLILHIHIMPHKIELPSTSNSMDNTNIQKPPWLKSSSVNYHLINLIIGLCNNVYGHVLHKLFRLKIGSKFDGAGLEPKFVT